MRWSKARVMREMRWHEIARADLILGIVPDYSVSNMHKVAEMLAARVAAGKVEKRKAGTAQSAAAYYWVNEATN